MAFKAFYFKLIDLIIPKKNTANNDILSIIFNDNLVKLDI